MNTCRIASFLLPAALATSLAAQDLRLEAAVGPRTMTAAVQGAADGSIVVLVLGLQEAATKLPDGQILGVAPDMLVGFAISNHGSAQLYTRFTVESDSFAFYAQAVAIGERGSLTLSNVQRVESPTPPSGRRPAE